MLPYAVRATRGLHRLKLLLADDSMPISAQGGDGRRPSRPEAAAAQKGSVAEPRQVDSVTLAEALALTGGLPIRLLQIDAHCRDAANLHALAAAPLGTLARVEEVRLRGVAARGLECERLKLLALHRRLVSEGLGEPRADGNDLVFRRSAGFTVSDR